MKTERIKSLKDVGVIFADIDDTISTDGKITLQAYASLWRAFEHGLRVVPVTGRPAGWCDHIARMWPVDGVIGENGGLFFRMRDNGMQRVYQQCRETRARNKEKLLRIRDEILSAVPGCDIASDQQYREFDLAIDFCEDVNPLSKASIEKIVSIFEKHGAVAKISSIHVNGWFGCFDKLTMTKQYVEVVDKRRLVEHLGEYTFIGDSPNDEPMFAFFPLSFGVANVKRFLSQMNHHPASICDGVCGCGFAEAIDKILEARSLNDE